MSGRALRAAALIAAALLAASCTLTRLAYSNAAFAYSNAAPVLTWVLDDYVDLSSVQRELVRERLARAFAWHRAEELPEYHRFLDAVLRQAEDNLSVDEARADYRDMRASYSRLVERVLPDIAELLVQLDAGQVTQMERKFADDNRKMAKESARGTPAARLERRVKRYFDHIEEFTGTLDDAQRDAVARHVATIEDAVEERLAERRYRQAQILAVARAKPPRVEAVAALHRLLVRPESWRSPEYTLKVRAREEKLFEMVAALSVTLNAQQRAHFQRRMRGLMRDITELTAAS